MQRPQTGSPSAPEPHAGALGDHRDGDHREGPRRVPRGRGKRQPTRRRRFRTTSKLRDGLGVPGFGNPRHRGAGTPEVAAPLTAAAGEVEDHDLGGGAATAAWSSSTQVA